MSAFDDACDRVLARLTARGFRTRVVGAAALAAHGVSRSTRDVDLLVVDRAVLDDTAWRGIAGPGFELAVRLGDPTDPLEGVIRLESTVGDDEDWDAPVEQLDIVVLRARWAKAMMDRPGPPVPLGTQQVSAVDAADLILLKLYAGGPRDRWDVVALLEAASDRAALAAVVDERVRGLNAASQDLWERLKED